MFEDRLEDREEALLSDLPDGVREHVAAIVRRCEERILELEAERARLDRDSAALRETLAESGAGDRPPSRGGGPATPPAAPALERWAGRLIGAESGLREVLRLVEKLAVTPIPVLIIGETGTGKDLVAKCVHERGPRRRGPFVAVNCAAVSEALLESELFGIESGVATGVRGQPGRLELAAGGTLFLDAVADMTPRMQTKLLRALQEREIERVGGSGPVSIDLRIVSATNRDLGVEVAAGRFRLDLYYRLAGGQVRVPPLRERRGDIEPLASHFVASSAREFRRRVKTVSPEARRALARYDWPGNVRELELEVRRAVAMAEGERVDLRDLAPHVRAAARREAPDEPIDPATGTHFRPLREARETYERAYLERVLIRAGGSHRRTANLLGLTSEGLRKRLMVLGLAARHADAS